MVQPQKTPIICDQCMKYLPTKSDLRKHLRQHTGGYGYGYGYDCGLWRDAPLESVQWPPPVRFSTNGITSGKVIPLKTPPFGCKYSTGEDHIVCQGCSYFCQIRKCT